MSFFNWVNSSQSFWENVEYLGEILVLLGVILEYRAASIGERSRRLLGPPDLKFVAIDKLQDEIHKKSSQIATFVLAFGLVVALVGIIKANRLSGEKIAALNAEAAKENARASSAEKALADMGVRLGPRNIFDKVEDISQRLKSFGPERVDVFVSDPGWEPFLLVMQVTGCFARGGWSPKLWRVSGLPGAGIEVDVQPNAPAKVKAAAEALRSALDLPGLNMPPHLGIKTDWPVAPFLGRSIIEVSGLIDAEKWDNGSAAPIRILIGGKV